MKYLIFIVALVASCQQVQELSPSIVEQDSNTNSLLQAISIVDQESVWVSGHKGTYCNTKDGGVTWEIFKMQDADTLQFRDIEAFDDSTVILMSAGPGELSQIRKTIDAGKTWSINYIMDEKEGFLDCMAFWDNKTGVVYGDQINGELFILRTEDGGETWERVDPARLPPAKGTEGGFAASGTCVEIREGGYGWIGTGAGEEPRVLITEDYGKTWSAYKTPIIAGEAAGITSIRFWDDGNGLIVGGDLKQTNEYTNNIATTSDGGRNWTNSSQPVTNGAFYGSDVIHRNGKKIAFACGPNGLDYTLNKAESWINLSKENFWAVEFLNDGIGWAVGTDGRITKITFN